jgi:hypothetical protein
MVSNVPTRPKALRCESTCAETPGRIAAPTASMNAQRE